MRLDQSEEREEGREEEGERDDKREGEGASIYSIIHYTL